MLSSPDRDELHEGRRLLEETDAAGLVATGRPEPVDCFEGNEESVDAAPIDPALARRLYVSHFLSAWNSRLFEFGSVLFLAAIYPASLLPVSVYALFRAVAAVLLSPAVGLWIDRADRLRVVRTSILGERLAIAASCVILWVLSRRDDAGSWLGHGLFAVVVLLAGVEKLCSVMNQVAVTRDWVWRATGRFRSPRRLTGAAGRCDYRWQ
jgi:solute carrier family 40 (iron-regulated transporter), member 1